MNRLKGLSDDPSRRSPRLVAVVVLALGLVAAGCTSAASGNAGASSTTSTTTTVPPNLPKLSNGQLKHRFDGFVAANNATFGTFAKAFRALGPGSTNAQLRTDVAPASAELVRAARGIYALRLQAPKAVSRTFVNVVNEYNLIYQGLQDLAAGYGSRAFNLAGWATAFQQALDGANSAVTAADKGLAPPKA
ncbi:MAG: hypothetical protein JWM85_1081 [Acidimicrobiaceae bacterium]|nr:hypothetical protein [Acidimicrobiaceae bacterium]